MSIYEKARELGQLLLSSEESIRFSDAVAAVKEENELYSNILKLKKDKDTLQQSAEASQYNPLASEILELENQLQEDPRYQELQACERAYMQLVRRITAICTSTALQNEEEPGGCESCSRNCNGCNQKLGEHNG